MSAAGRAGEPFAALNPAARTAAQVPAAAPLGAAQLAARVWAARPQTPRTAQPPKAAQSCHKPRQPASHSPTCRNPARPRDAVVYSATCPKLGGAPVVLKVYEKAGISQVKHRAVRREARIMRFVTSAGCAARRGRRGLGCCLFCGGWGIRPTRGAPPRPPPAALARAHSPPGRPKSQTPPHVRGLEPPCRRPPTPPLTPTPPRARARSIPSVCRYIGAFQDSRQIYIVMERAEGGDLLESLLAEGRAMTERRAVREVRARGGAGRVPGAARARRGVGPAPPNSGPPRASVPQPAAFSGFKRARPRPARAVAAARSRAEQTRPPPPRQVVAPILSCLAHLHAAGVIHRDIKLENLFVSPSRGVLLGDYGLAVCVHEEKPISPVGTLGG